MSATPESSWATVDSAGVDRLIKGLDRLRAEPFFADAKRRLDAFLPSRDGARVVDVGCGTGEDTARAARRGRVAVGVERSIGMTVEARRRHATLLLLAGDARQLPLCDRSVDAVRADRVLQHLSDGVAALQEWRRVLRPGGVVVSFDPELATATVDGVVPEVAERVLAWRTATRAGAHTVQTLDGALVAVGFDDVQIERHVLDLTSLAPADGIMGLAGWGDLAAAAGAVSKIDAGRWSNDVRRAHNDGALRYRCTYALGVGRIPV